MKRSVPVAGAAPVRKSVDTVMVESSPRGTLWVCARCPYVSAHLPGGGHCPMCAAQLIGQCKCGAVILGEVSHPCEEIRSA